MWTGSLKFMSLVKTVWELSNLHNKLLNLLDLTQLWSANRTWVLEIRSQFCTKIFLNTLTGLFKFMSPVNNVWKLSTLAHLLAEMHNLSTHNGHNRHSRKMFCGSVVPSFLKNTLIRLRILGCRVCAGLSSDKLRYSDYWWTVCPGMCWAILWQIYIFRQCAWVCAGLSSRRG